MEWFYVYILLSKKDGKLYTGFTNNIKRRIKEHNKGYVISTKDRRPFELIYCEVCKDKNDALAREKYLKSGMGKRFLKNRLKFYLENL